MYKRQEKQIVTDTSNYWIDYRAEEFDGGNGDKDNPYVIANAEELALLSYEEMCIRDRCITVHISRE